MKCGDDRQVSRQEVGEVDDIATSTLPSCSATSKVVMVGHFDSDMVVQNPSAVIWWEDFVRLYETCMLTKGAREPE